MGIALAGLAVSGASDSSSRSREHRVHGIDGMLPNARQDLAVDVHGGRYLAVAKPLHHHPRWDAFSQQERCT